MQRLGRFILAALEIVILSVLILAVRCANYEEVFAAGNVYFTDADCYARMTRVRMCAAHPGLVVRHHDFENFPEGTTPHTTAPLDYLIVSLSILLKPFTAQAIDLAGAIVSPLFALIGGWFLWWWSRWMKFRYRWVLLVLYAISPILVHGTELGRPDHQSLLMLLVAVGISGEWSSRIAPSTASAWSIVSGIAWGFAFWVSAYEPLLLLLTVIVAAATQGGHILFGKQRRAGWISFAAVLAIALLIERRIPSWSIFYSSTIFRNWSRTIGELASVSPLNRIWFLWAGYLVAIAPLLIWLEIRRRPASRTVAQPESRDPAVPTFMLALLVVTYLLTIWQARWAYFFVLIFAIALPGLLEPITPRVAIWIAFGLSIFPILRDWDQRLWPNEMELVRRVEHRNESIGLRELAITMQSLEMRPFLAPWWLSPSMSYWSQQPAVAGSSHESIAGIADSARFYLENDPRRALELLGKRNVAWVLAYDVDWIAQNSAAVLGAAVPDHPLCRTIDRTPGQAPRYLALSVQNGAGKLFRVTKSP